MGHRIEGWHLSPHVHVSDSRFGIWWRRWVGTIALVLILVGGTIGFKKVEDEGNTRESQFCALVLGSLEDRQHRVVTTEEFLDSPAGEAPTVFNDYIREISFPQTKVEVQKEEDSIPGICWKYASKSTREGAQ